MLIMVLKQLLPQLIRKNLIIKIVELIEKFERNIP